MDMKTRAMPATLVSLLTLATLATLASAGKNPCHDHKWMLGRDVSCEKVVVPAGLCSACKLKEPRGNGNFADCRSIYDLTSQNCRQQLKYYADLNKKCDPIRVRQTNDFGNQSNVQGLDYFVYSLCEQCCDCVPRGAKTNQYQRRKKTGRLLSANRGNCPAHAWYDICTIWPQLRYVVRPDGRFAPPMPGDGVPPKICPLLTTWINRPPNRNWLYKSGLFVDKPIKTFFESFFQVSNCANWHTWRSCTDLESKQKRL